MKKHIATAPGEKDIVKEYTSTEKGRRTREITKLKKERAANQYAEDRRAKYPSVEEQLDMLYHDKAKGTSMWVATIAAVKALYPKPEEL